MSGEDAIFAGMGFFVLIVAASIVVWIALSIGIGYWCMKVFEGKGLSRGLGFLMGFAFTMFFSLVGAAAAVVVAYLWDVPVTQGGPATTRQPAPPPPVSPEALTVATFTSATGWHGRRVLYDRAALQIEGVCQLQPGQVLDYARQGHLTWASDDLRAWIEDWARG